MPVIGHALVGVVIAQKFGPVSPAPARSGGWITRALWVPAIVSLSYLPDVLTQCGVWLGFGAAQAAGHSFLVALAIGVPVGLVWGRASGESLLRMAILATGVILLHDVMDLFQDHERMPLWPLSTVEVGVNSLMFSNRLAGELLTFGLPFLAWQIWRVAAGRPTAPALGMPAPARWVSLAFVFGVVLVSVGVIQLRQEREARMERAEELLRAGRLDEAMASLDAAERWPFSPGDGDLIRGRVYVRMGNDERAEQVFLRAHRDDPDNFWTVAVLAEFYAGRGSTEVRRARSEPYVDRLRREFAGDESFPRVIERIERALRSGDGR